MGERLSRRDLLKLSGGAVVYEIGRRAGLEKLPSSENYYFSHGESDTKIALTIDDGWFPEKVEKAVNALIVAKIPTTFFPVGAVIKKSPELWRDIAKEGFEIHNHTYSHPDLGGADVDLNWQIRGWEEAYESLGIGEYTHKILRLPANTGITKMSSVAQKHGYKGVAGWSAGSEGYRWGVEKTKNNLLPKIDAGGIILTHFVDTDIQLLPDLQEYAKQNELEFVKLSDLPGTPAYIEKTAGI